MNQNLEEEVSISTQTEEEDTNDTAILNQLRLQGGFFSRNQDQGFLSNLITRVLPSRLKQDSLYVDEFRRWDRRTVSSQTEELDPVTARGQQLAHVVIQDLAMEFRPIPSSAKDDVYNSLCHCVLEILEKHTILFNGMVNRIEVTSYRVFESVANELFEANANGNNENDNGSVQIRVTWGRIVSLFAFAVRLAKEYKDDPARVQEITRYLASYITKHVVPFVIVNGGWAGLVDTFPAPVDVDAQFRRAVLWSGLCVGLVATMYVSSVLR